MRKIVIFTSGLLFMVITFCITVFGADSCNINWNTLCAYGETGVEGTKVYLPEIRGNDTMYLPSSLTPDSLTLFAEIPGNTRVKICGALGECEFYSGAVINLNKICNYDDYRVKFVADNGNAFSEYQIKFCFSKNIPAMYICSDNPKEKGRLWIDWSEDKSNKATGTMIMQKPGGRYVYNGVLTQIKGRGNTTWQLEKKPYQIKLEQKTDLLESGNADNKNKTWILLANYIDSSNLRNTTALNIGKMSGMPVNIESRHVDLYYDGEYRGNYLLAEKVELGKGRVDIANLEDENEKANPQVSAKDLPVATATTANGATYTYCEGLVSPPDVSGGYLIEMDFEVRAIEEVCYFKTSRNQHVVVKSPEYATKEEMDYIATLYQEYEDAVFNGGVNPYTNKSYSDYIDAESVAKYFLINELSKSRDCFKSSAYLHKDKNNNRMVMGPLWDYDMSFGRGGYDYNVFDDVYGLVNIENDFVVNLLEIGDFFNTVKNTYTDIIYPCVKKYISAQSYISGQRSNSLLLYSDYIRVSSECNSDFWYPGSLWNDEFTLMYNFVSQRTDVLHSIINAPVPLGIQLEEVYLDVYPYDWYYEWIYDAKRRGYINGMGNRKYAPLNKVERSHLAQILYNIGGNAYAEYKSYYPDVSEADWFSPAVSWITGNGINVWSDEIMFSPGASVTRGELVESIFRIFGCESVFDGSVLNSFADKHLIPPHQIQAFCWAVSNNIINGYEDGEIKPTNHLSRGELAAILVRYDNAVNAIAG